MLNRSKPRDYSDSRASVLPELGPSTFQANKGGPGLSESDRVPDSCSASQPARTSKILILKYLHGLPYGVTMQDTRNVLLLLVAGAGFFLAMYQWVTMIAETIR